MDTYSNSSRWDIERYPCETGQYASIPQLWRLFLTALCVDRLQRWKRSFCSRLDLLFKSSVRSIKCTLDCTYASSSLIESNCRVVVLTLGFLSGHIILTSRRDIAWYALLASRKSSKGVLWERDGYSGDKTSIVEKVLVEMKNGMFELLSIIVSIDLCCSRSKWRHVIENSVRRDTFRSQLTETK